MPDVSVNSSEDGLAIREIKRRIRKSVLEMRDAMPEERRREESAILVQKVLSLSAYRAAKRVLLYASYGSEVETDGLILEALSAGKQVYLPRVNCDLMSFYRIGDLKELSDGYKGIREPDAHEESKLMLTNDKTFLLLPGVAFDQEGGRIGYGKGFYDRFLASAEGYSMETAAALFDCQLTEKGQIPMEETDRLVPVLITPTKTIHTGRV